MVELLDTLGPIGRALVLTSVAVLWTVVLVRIVGLRAFSKMTSFDFVATIATGSLIAQAGTRAVWSEYLQAMGGIAGVFLVQWLLARLRQKSDTAQNVLTNQPVLLMEDGRFLDAALDETRVSRLNLIEKLRLAGVTDISRVRAVVLEMTGDISVIQGDDVDDQLLDGVRRIESGQA